MPDRAPRFPPITNDEERTRKTLSTLAINRTSPEKLLIYKYLELEQIENATDEQLDERCALYIELVKIYKSHLRWVLSRSEIAKSREPVE